jgi:hypothetical protein
MAKQPVAVVMGEFSGVCSQTFHTFLHLNDRSTTPWVYDKVLSNVPGRHRETKTVKQKFKKKNLFMFYSCISLLNFMIYIERSITYSGLTLGEVLGMK